MARDESLAGSVSEDAPSQAVAPPGPSRHAGTVTLNFDDADLVEVIHVLARHLRLNYTVDEDVGGTVTLFSGHPVRRDDLLPIFHELLRIHDAVAVKRGNLYRITSIAKGSGLARPGAAKGPGFAMHVLPVRFLPVSAMKRLLMPFMGEGGSMLEHVRGNYLVLVDLPSNIRRLAEIRDLIDVRVFAGTRMELYRPMAASARELAREMSAAMRLFAASGAQDDHFAARFLPLPRINQLLVIAYSEAAWQYVKRWIERIDVVADTPGRKVFIRPVENGKAMELARVLGRLYGSGGSPVRDPRPRRARRRRTPGRRNKGRRPSGTGALHRSCGRRRRSPGGRAPGLAGSDAIAGGSSARAPGRIRGRGTGGCGAGHELAGHSRDATGISRH